MEIKLINGLTATLSLCCHLRDLYWFSIYDTSGKLCYKQHIAMQIEDIPKEIATIIKFNS